MTAIDANNPVPKGRSQRSFCSVFWDFIGKTGETHGGAAGKQSNESKE
jgi:hypothetical protein